MIFNLLGFAIAQHQPTDWNKYDILNRTYVILAFFRENGESLNSKKFIY